jgi:hypothetical protein
MPAFGPIGINQFPINVVLLISGSATKSDMHTGIISDPKLSRVYTTSSRVGQNRPLIGNLKIESDLLRSREKG